MYQRGVNHHQYHSHHHPPAPLHQQHHHHPQFLWSFLLWLVCFCCGAGVLVVFIGGIVVAIFSL